MSVFNSINTTIDCSKFKFFIVGIQKNVKMAFVVSVLQVRNIENIILPSITFSFVGLKIRVNRPIIKLDDKKIIICV